MKELIPLMKQIELELRSNNTNLNKYIWEELSNLTDWEYRIIQDFKLRVNLYIKNNNDNFVYKLYEQNIENIRKNKEEKLDLLITTIKRDKIDTILTDVYNQVPIPNNLKYDFLEIWGEYITKARNFAVKEALKRNCKYLLFIDDDIIAPQGSIIQLFNRINNDNIKVISGQYYRKMEPLITAHGKLNKYKDNLYTTDLCAMGFTLIDIDYVSQYVPLPLFWEFAAPDGHWSMGEDAFFTNNLLEYTDTKPIVDTDLKLLHYDKKWKKIYGYKDNDVIYATNAITNFEQFEKLREPPKFPLIAVCTPTRTEKDPIAVDLSNMLLLRGYKADPIRIYGLQVDQARTELVKHALKMEADYVLFIDDDIIPPIDGVCKLLEIFENGKDNKIGAVSGDYCLKGEPTYSVHLQLNESGIVKELDKLNIDNKIINNNWLIGLGFALIDINFFKQAREPWFICHTKNTKEININEDAHCSELLFINGYEIIINKSIKCLHVDYENMKIYGFEDTIDLSKYAGYSYFNKFEYIGMNNHEKDNN